MRAEDQDFERLDTKLDFLIMSMFISSGMKKDRAIREAQRAIRAINNGECATDMENL